MRTGTIIEIGIVGAAIAAAGAFYLVQTADADVATKAQASEFTSTDFHAFDRNFDMDGRTCAVGLKSDRMCFGESPHAATRYIGETLPVHVPAISAEFPVVVSTELKADNLKTLRFGHTLALFDPETREIVDLMDMTAPRYADARPVKTSITS